MLQRVSQTVIIMVVLLPPETPANSRNSYNGQSSMDSLSIPLYTGAERAHK